MKELIDNKELVIALEELEKEKGIKKDYVIEAIETALVTAYKRNLEEWEQIPLFNTYIGGFFFGKYRRKSRKFNWIYSK